MPAAPSALLKASSTSLSTLLRTVASSDDISSARCAFAAFSAALTRGFGVVLP